MAAVKDIGPLQALLSSMPTAKRRILAVGAYVCVGAGVPGQTLETNF